MQQKDVVEWRDMYYYVQSDIIIWTSNSNETHIFTKLCTRNFWSMHFCLCYNWKWK